MSRHSRARVSYYNFEPSAVCDRCAARYSRSDLVWQHDWAGRSMVNKRWLVCRECLDEPSNMYRAVILKPDPVPVKDPRPVARQFSEQNVLTTESGLTLVGEDGGYLAPQNQANASVETVLVSLNGTTLATLSGDALVADDSSSAWAGNGSAG